MRHQHAQLTWTNTGVPVSEQFQDPYFSLHDGLAETRHVFLDGSDLPQRFRDGFHIAELGFGTGLNFLASVAAFRASGCKGVLRYTSFEAFPMSEPDRLTALSRYPHLPLDALGNPPDVVLEIIVGDAREMLPAWNGAADAWFLDGFAPARNPEMWEDALLLAVGNHTRMGGTVATYTAAGRVRRALEAAGFAVTRVPGFGRKRHMTRGEKA